MSNDLPLQTISDAALINPPLTRAVKQDEEVSFIPMSDVSESAQLIGKQTRRQREVMAGYTAFEEGDVLFAKITPCMENGKGCHAVGLVNGIGYGSTEFHVLRARQGTNGRFLYYWSTMEALRKKAEAFMIGSAGQQRVQPSFFNQFYFPRLEEKEQEFAAGILNVVNGTIQKTEQLIAKLKAMKQGVLHDLLTRGLHENGELRDPIAHPEQFKDSPLGRIPKEWDIESIEEISSHVGSGLTPRGGSDVYRDSGVMFIRSQNVTFEGLKLYDVAFIDHKTHQVMKRSEVYAHDVLINITGASIGRCCPLPEGFSPANVNQHVCAIRLQDPCFENALFLSTALASPIGQRQINNLNAGSNREGLNYQQLKAILIPWPTRKNERILISGNILRIELQITSEQNYLTKLKLIKKGIMHDLLTGKVRVAVDDRDQKAYNPCETKGE